HVRSSVEPLLARHGDRRPPAHHAEPRAHHLFSRGGRALGAQAAAVDRDRSHGASRCLRPPAGSQGVRLEDVPLGYAHRRGVVAPGAQRSPPREHERCRQGPRHRLRPRAADDPDGAHGVPPVPARVRSRDHFSALRVHHQHARHRAERGPRAGGTAASLLARPFDGQPPRRDEEGATKVRAVLPLQLRSLPAARRALLLEGAAGQRAGRGDARHLLGVHDLLRPRGPRREELPGRHARSRSGPVVRDADRIDEQLRGQPPHLGALRRARPADRASPVPYAPAATTARDRAGRARHLRTPRYRVQDGHLGPDAQESPDAHRKPGAQRPARREGERRIERDRSRDVLMLLEVSTTPDMSTTAEPNKSSSASASEYTIDELAAAAKVPSRTIRFYQSRGALMPPEIRGRVAFYGPPHLDRLKLIAQLQDRGLRIDAIRDLLTSIDRGEVDLAEWLRVEPQGQAPWGNDQPRTVTEDELYELAGSRRPALVADLLRNKMIERHGDVYLVQSPALLSIAMRLEGIGVDLVTARRAEETVRKHVGRASSELVEMFV